MTHTLAAVFDNRGDAERARSALLGSGFGDSNVRLSDADTGSATQAAPASRARDDQSIGSSIKHFFGNLFGDEDETATYAEAVNRGHAVLTVEADSLDEVERAADIVEGYGPVDIEERKSEWSATGWTGAARAGTAAAGTGQYVGSQQSAQGGTAAGSTAGAASMQRQGSAASQQRAGTAEQTIPVIQEELKIGKRSVQRGGVRIFQRVVETPVNENVTLREEHVKVERHAVDQPADPADIEAFKETTFELRESAEEAVVQKTARVVEEVVVGKEVTQRDDQVSETLRRTEVDVEQFGATEDEDYYRSHWTSTYANMGGSYDDYAPAYRYGTAMAGADSYRGRSWDDSEASLRSSWESQYPKSAWDKVKAAVRHGWERLTS